MPRISSVLCSLHPYAYYSNDFEIGSSKLKEKDPIMISCKIQAQKSNILLIIRYAGISA